MPTRSPQLGHAGSAGDRRGLPDAIEAYDFPAGSMGPKVEAAAEFARRNPGRAAVIGALEDLPAIMAGEAGTRITTDAAEISFR